MKRLCYYILLMLLSGCAKQMPTAISKSPTVNITVNQVRMDIDKYAAAQVRWGGEISKVENKAARTWVEIVSQALSKNGQPLSDSKSHGRFIASFPGFIDPVVYKIGASVTVVGTISGESVAMIGEYAYHFPVVLVSGAHLWPQRVKTLYRPYRPSPWMYHQPWPDYYRRHPYTPWPYYNRPYPFSR